MRPSERKETRATGWREAARTSMVAYLQNTNDDRAKAVHDRVRISLHSRRGSTILKKHRSNARRLCTVTEDIFVCFRSMLSDENNSDDHSPTLDLIRSIVDELYYVTAQQTSADVQCNDQHVRFTGDQRADEVSTNECRHRKTSGKYQPVLSDSVAIVCCSIPGRAKVDRSASTDELLCSSCDNATQTVRTTIDDSCARSRYALLIRPVTWACARARMYLTFIICGIHSIECCCSHCIERRSQRVGQAFVTSRVG